jgi:transposase-like protein
MMKCPRCHAEERQVKSGLTDAGSQRYKCQACSHRYTPEPKPRGYSDAVRLKAVRMYVDGGNLRRIARHLEVSHQSVANWVNAFAAHLPDAPVPEEVDTVELDELYTFIKRKKTASTS